jgi:hypothetical protein
MKTVNVHLNGNLLTISGKSFNAGDYSAKTDGTLVTIVHRNNPNALLYDAPNTGLKLNGTAYGSGALFCTAFNALTLAANTESTDTPFSALATPAQETHVQNVVKRGWFILSCPDTNAGIVNYGATGLGATSAGISPGGSIFIPSGDMSKWFVKNQTATDVVNIVGEYKA